MDEQCITSRVFILIDPRPGTEYRPLFVKEGHSFPAGSNAEQIAVLLREHFGQGPKTVVIWRFPKHPQPEELAGVVLAQSTLDQAAKGEVDLLAAMNALLESVPPELAVSAASSKLDRARRALATSARLGARHRVNAKTTRHRRKA